MASDRATSGGWTFPPFLRLHGRRPSYMLTVQIERSVTLKRLTG